MAKYFGRFYCPNKPKSHQMLLGAHEFGYPYKRIIFDIEFCNEFRKDGTFMGCELPEIIKPFLNKL